ncbi:LytR/AlgR family response regulator transcription factor [Neptunitalea lumnitzerae]|uniref:DNA-binding response regulator n=1 Tax=Neptunitalea lumnitzerae TaxID=2965509 RepID=A0ABQ5MJ29_9FLAO|nr:LytTR family DNA-binding domain-containing protein [Neptunitalea sp. Y10]GLB49425.1 DNA-binding response regulator [Neptunitalea sp. Y10]
MKITNVFIVEDEEPNVARLQRLLKNMGGGIEIVGIADSVQGAVQWLQTHELPDLLLLDIRLSDGLSFEIFDHVNINCAVIFTTAYDEYAVKAFKYNSIDYLLKPIEELELRNAIARYENFMETLPFINTAVTGLVQYLQPKNYRTRFLLPYRDGYRTLQIVDILFMYTELGITYAYLNTNTIETLPQTLEELEKELDPLTFFRVNRQYIVKEDAIVQIQNDFNGKLRLLLQGADRREVVVSRDKAPLLKAWLDF